MWVFEIYFKRPSNAQWTKLSINNVRPGRAVFAVNMTTMATTAHCSGKGGDPIDWFVD